MKIFLAQETVDYTLYAMLLMIINLKKITSTSELLELFELPNYWFGDDELPSIANY